MPWEKFSEFGLVGLLMGVIAFFAWLLLTRALDGREKDLAWHRGELDLKRKEYLEALKGQQDLFRATLAALESRWERVTESILQRLDELADDLRTVRGDRERERDRERDREREREREHDREQRIRPA